MLRSEQLLEIHDWLGNLGHPHPLPLDRFTQTSIELALEERGISYAHWYHALGKTHTWSLTLISGNHANSRDALLEALYAYIQQEKKTNALTSNGS